MTSPNLLDGVELFMTAAGQPIPEKPAVPPARILAARLLMLFEEFDELLISIGIEPVDVETAHGARDGAEWLTNLLEETWRTEKAPDLVEMVDAFLDITVVAYGGSLETAGLAGTHAAAAEVTRSNLAKILPDGTCLKREDGKVLKPEGWRPPNIAEALSV